MRTTISVDGRPRSFIAVGEPDGPAGRPLVLVFHGSRQNAEAHRTFSGRLLDRLAENGRAVVAYLDGYRGNWNDARAASTFPARREQIDDVAFARATVDALVASHGVDPGAVVGVGYSNGGQMIFRLLHEEPPLLAGAVAIAATMPDAEGFLLRWSSEPRHPVPVTLIAGTSDPIVPYDGGTMAWWARTLFRVGGTALSAVDTARYFASRNGITEPAMTRPLSAESTADAAVRMERTAYGAGTSAPVLLYTVIGGGHTIPGATRAPAIIGRTGRERGIDEIVGEVLRSLGR